jgi:hypothetical protein
MQNDLLEPARQQAEEADASIRAAVFLAHHRPHSRYRIFASTWCWQRGAGITPHSSYRSKTRHK